MKCKVTFEYEEQHTLALANKYGWDRPATHEEMLRHFEDCGKKAMANLMYELEHGYGLGNGFRYSKINGRNYKSLMR